MQLSIILKQKNRSVTKTRGPYFQREIIEIAGAKIFDALYFLENCFTVKSLDCFEQPINSSSKLD